MAVLCSPGWHRTLHSPSAGLQVCTTMPSNILTLLKSTDQFFSQMYFIWVWLIFSEFIHFLTIHRNDILFGASHHKVHNINMSYCDADLNHWVKVGFWQVSSL
jgi:hypothetical protein